MVLWAAKQITTIYIDHMKCYCCDFLTLKRQKPKKRHSKKKQKLVKHRGKTKKIINCNKVEKLYSFSIKQNNSNMTTPHFDVYNFYKNENRAV